MLNSDLVKAREHKAAQIKTCRILFGFNIATMSKRSGLSVETIHRIENGSKTWTVDSELTYLKTLDLLIDEKQTSKPNLKLPEKPAFLLDLKKAI